MVPIIVSTLWLLVLVVGDTILTARLIQRRLLGRHIFLLSFVVGVAWLATLLSWALLTILLGPSDSRGVIFIGTGFVALAASLVFALCAAIAIAAQARP